MKDNKHIGEESEFWNKLLSSDAKSELLQLFHQNPKSAYKINEIAKKISRKKEEFEGDLDELMELGVIRRKPNPGSFYLDEEKEKEVQAHLQNTLRVKMKGK